MPSFFMGFFPSFDNIDFNYLCFGSDTTYLVLFISLQPMYEYIVPICDIHLDLIRLAAAFKSTLLLCTDTTINLDQCG